jgi:hypothetical protein
MLSLYDNIFLNTCRCRESSSSALSIKEYEIHFIPLKHEGGERERERDNRGPTKQTAGLVRQFQP